MEPYKPGQAKTSRSLVLLTGLFLILWGCVRMALALPQMYGELGWAWNQFDFAGGALPEDAWVIDLVVVTTRLGPAPTISLIVAAACSFWWWRFLNKPKWADLLIEMEIELKKVSWPTPSDAWQSTLVVTGFTVALIVTIMVYDLAIKNLLQLISGVA